MALFYTKGTPSENCEINLEILYLFLLGEFLFFLEESFMILIGI